MFPISIACPRSALPSLLSAIFNEFALLKKFKTFSKFLVLLFLYDWTIDYLLFSISNTESEWSIDHSVLGLFLQLKIKKNKVEYIHSLILPCKKDDIRESAKKINWSTCSDKLYKKGEVRITFIGFMKFHLFWW